MIEVKRLSKTYKKANRKALSDVSFELKSGEMIGLIGLNGAGKSTLLKLICKYLKPSEGEIYIDGKEISEFNNILDNVGILLEPVFFDHISAADNLKYYLQIHNKLEYMEDIEEMLELVGLLSVMHKKPSTFSFGMKQRLGLAMALIGDPQILILDEPFIGLDPNGVNELMIMLKKRIEEKNICAIISSHQLFELGEICKRIIVINDGKLVFDGIPDLDPEKSLELIRMNKSPLEQFFKEA